ncbi:FecR family protein [Pyxidicoccus xibeiensis]|uniref:FecR family protein n=1 Tax=Pyxidicoccus xibeiensis TaxID=2906759 RepID=UPI0020A718FC|nr:FecR domain-containing protein [Pyxidicoccus xibeiensis]MCP3137690.1 FecR domain-containing protein [Pyxidicoccus xibeiensis]
MKRTAAWMMALVLVASPALAAEADGPCGSLRFEGGLIETGRPLAPKGPQTEACLKQVAEALKARPAIRSVTLAARLPDAERLDGQGLAVAKAAADVLVAAGLPRTRVSVVAPPSVPGEAARLQLAYLERPAQPAVARVRAASGEVSAGTAAAELRPRAPGDALYSGELLHTGPGARVELALADGSRVRLMADSSLRLGTIELMANLRRKVQLELLRGTVEADAAPSGEGSLFEVRTRSAVAGVRGTHFRVTAQEDGTHRLETLEGRVALIAKKGDLDVIEGYGSRALPDSAPEPPRPLLKAPTMVDPRDGTFAAPPRLTWGAVSGARAYRVELARTADFAAGVRTHEAPAAELAVTNLDQGKWFWRVVALDGEGFVGFPSKIFAFDVRP